MTPLNENFVMIQGQPFSIHIVELEDLELHGTLEASDLGRPYNIVQGAMIFVDMYETHNRARIVAHPDRHYGPSCTEIVAQARQGSSLDARIAHYPPEVRTLITAAHALYMAGHLMSHTNEDSGLMAETLRGMDMALRDVLGQDWRTLV